MSVREPTRQQLDPAGTAGTRTLTGTLALGAVGYALVMTIAFRGEISQPLPAVLALAVLTASCLLLFMAASAYRAPFTRATHYVIHAGLLAAIGLEAAGQRTSDAMITNDWGPICLGVIIIALSPYRPARELAAAGVVSAILIGFLTLLRAEQLARQAPPFAFVAVAVTPMLALCFGASVFSSGLVYSIRRWQRRAVVATRNLMAELRSGIARSVQQNRVTILDRDVLPFFSDLLARNVISEEDRVQARSIADSIRRVMVAEFDRSWLENLIELAGGVGADAGAAATVVDDPDRAAPAMGSDQRTAVRALLVAMIDIPNFDRHDLRIRLSKEGTGCRGEIVANLDVADHLLRSALAPYFAVMRAVFTDFQIDSAQPTLTLRFSYEQQ
ncbi:hypothetical protein [Glaciihabitans sp. UYNi722]|uniref:hypothetical protein n=1 Tax=Glaciihabitans sp. UYNi722 TaxID=3156344 RepID=UPI003396B11D